MNYLDGKPGRTAKIKGKEYTFFSGYNYLGINEDPEFQELVLEGAARFGWLFPSSRISNTRLEIYEECEALLSAITGSEDTVLTTSGFNAGQIATQGYSVVNAPGSHPAILKCRSKHHDFKDWTQWITDELNSGQLEERVIASDTVNPLSATLHDFNFLSGIQHSLRVILDDSHGIGLIGQGKGIGALVPRVNNIEYTFTYSLSKAFGISGGAISCSSEEATRLRSLPAYTAVTPQSPAQLYAFIKGQHIYARQQEKLRANIQHFGECVSDLPGIHFHPDLPVFVLDERYREEDFLQRGILISSFAYPDPAGKKLNRIVLNALHTPDDLENLSSCLREIEKQQENILHKPSSF